MRRLFAFWVALASIAFSGAASADVWDRVKASGTLRIVTDATYQPFEFVDRGQIVGFDRELGDAVSRELGVAARWQSMEWAGVLPSLLAGKADLVISGVTITEERKRAYRFSRPYFLSGQVVVRRRGAANATVSVVGNSGGTVAVQQETTGQTAAERAGIPKDRIHRFDTLQDALLDVANGRSSIAVGDLPAVREMIRRDYPTLELSPEGVFVRENVGMVGGPGSERLLGRVNRAIARLMVDGTYDRIHRKWMGSPLETADIAALEAQRDAGSPVPEPDIATDAPSAPQTDIDSEAGSSAGLAVRWNLVPSLLPALLDGAKLTIVLTVGSLAIGTPLGLLVALGARARQPWLSRAATAFVEAIRGTPLLLQIYVLYFVLPALAPNLGDSLGPMASGLAALAINCAAYCAEIFRAGIDSVDRGQSEAARALGMNGTQALRHVVLPQAFQRSLPPLTNEAVALLKDSSLVSVVALSELTRVGKELVTRNGSPSTVYLLVAFLYLAMTLPLTMLSRAWEKRLGGGAKA